MVFRVDSGAGAPIRHAFPLLTPNYFGFTHIDIPLNQIALTAIQSQYLVPTLIQRRKGTRVRAQIPLRITSLDTTSTFSENCHTLLVNPLGCGVRFPRSLKPGLRLRIENLPCGGSVIAQVASNLPPTHGNKYWVVGIGWDSPENLWCLAPTPADWEAYAAAPQFFPASVRSSGADPTTLDSRKCR
jgi:hypothetical protein